MALSPLRCGPRELRRKKGGAVPVLTYLSRLPLSLVVTVWRQLAATWQGRGVHLAPEASTNTRHRPHSALSLILRPIPGTFFCLFLCFFLQRLACLTTYFAPSEEGAKYAYIVNVLLPHRSMPHLVLLGVHSVRVHNDICCD